MVLNFSSFPSTDNPLTNQMPECTTAVAIFAFQQHAMYQLEKKDFEMACSSKETILFGVAFEEALVEVVRSYQCFWDPIS